MTQQILARAQGVPLYAVETVRMLLDRGLLVQDGPVYRPSGEVATLEVPETLHALAAARLDGLPADERALVGQACVLGKTFTLRALAALTGQPEAELEPLLSALVRKEVLSLQADPRAPERGQFGFLQELLRQVTYDTLSRRDRKARHLAAVTALEQSFQGADEEVPEVIAAHLLAAADAAPDDPDTAEIRLRARAALVHAGERAAALAAPEEAQQYLDQAAALADDDPTLRAELLQRAGTLAFQAGSPAAARERLEQALGLHEEVGDQLAAARASVALADVDVSEGRLEEAAHRFEAARATLEPAGPSAELAATLAQLGRMQALRGELEPAAATLERALELAETLALEETLAQALNSKGMVLILKGRQVEARALLETALARAHAAGLHAAGWRAANNLGVLLEHCEQYDDMLALRGEMEAQARQRGDREALAAARLGGHLGAGRARPLAGGARPGRRSRPDPGEPLGPRRSDQHRSRPLRARQPRRSSARPRRAGLAARCGAARADSDVRRGGGAAAARPQPTRRGTRRRRARPRPSRRPRDHEPVRQEQPGRGARGRLRARRARPKPTSCSPSPTTSRPDG